MAETNGFYYDLSPLIGENERIRGIAANADAFTGNEYIIFPMTNPAMNKRSIRAKRLINRRF